MKDGQDKDSRFQIGYGPRMYFVCGLLSILCKVTNDEPTFWRFIASMLERFEVHQVAGLCVVMFQCFPAQIGAYQEHFVQKCFRHIVLLHVVNVRNAKHHNSVLLEEVKQNYARFKTVLNRDDMLRKQLRKLVNSGGADPEVNGETMSGFMMFCDGDTRYAHNKGLPLVLYPVLLQQLQSNTARVEVQVFLLDLYCQCVERVCAKMALWTTNSKAMLAKTGILSVMEQIVRYSVATGKVRPLVVVCCIGNILRMEETQRVQEILMQNATAVDVLLQFATTIFEAWKGKIALIQNATMRKTEQQHFDMAMNITEGVFSRKRYPQEAFHSLKSKYC